MLHWRITIAAGSYSQKPVIGSELGNLFHGMGHNCKKNSGQSEKISERFFIFPERIRENF